MTNGRNSLGTYISTALTKDRREVIVWERNENGRYPVYYPAPYNYYIVNPNGNLKAVDGNTVSIEEYDDPYEFYEDRKRLRGQGQTIYESDISPQLKVLSDAYYNRSIETPLNITFFDIEVDYDPVRGHASPDNPYARISAISMYHTHTRERIALALPPESGKWKGTTTSELPQDILDSASVTLFDNEEDLIVKFFEEIEDTDIISGWNSEFFDDPYIYFRVKKILGEKYTTLMNFPEYEGKVDIREVEKFGRTETVVKPVGRVWIDFLQIFKKFDYGERSSYSLEAVSEEELPGIEKISHNKSLHALYHENFDDFLRYSIRDTEILEGLEKKFGYMKLSIDFSHVVTNEIHSVIGTVGTSDTAILGFCKHELDERVVIPDGKELDDVGKLTGALVLDPQVGLHENVASIDVTSLYPSVMRALNISPDTIIGQFIDSDNAIEGIRSESSEEYTIIYENSMDDTKTGKEWSNILKDRAWSISANGTVFDQHKKGIIPEILSGWFNSRKETRKKSRDYAKKAIQEKDPIKKKEYQALSSHYNTAQEIKKLQLNSMYGVFGNKYFRFFDVRIIESTTKTGQSILMHMAKMAASALEGEYTYPSETVIYGDTDSIYFKTGVEGKEGMMEIADVLTGFINGSNPAYMRDNFYIIEDRLDYINGERELLADKGIFVAKKHYMLHVINDDGRDVDDMVVAGLQIKKTNIPKFIRHKVTGMFEDFLKTERWDKFKRSLVEFKRYLGQIDLVELGIPMGVNKVEEYTEEYITPTGKTIPGHTKASIFYNICLEEYGDKESMRIISGTKIRRYYFVKGKTFGTFNSIALPTDLDIIPDWFEHFKKYIDREKQIDTLVNNPVNNILVAIGEAVPNEKNLLADELLEF